MKKSIPALICILLSVNLFCQDYEISSKTIPNTESEIYKKYYFQNSEVDSSIFLKDSISLYQNGIDAEDSKIVLYDNSKFCFFYKPTIDTITQSSNKSVCTDIIVFGYSNKITGTYSFFQIAESADELYDESLRFTFDDGSQLDYKIRGGKEKVVLVKK